MLLASSWAIFAILFVYRGESKSIASPSKNEDLLLLHLIFRHGNVTNDKKHVYPNDPHKNATYYPFGYGQLVNAGKIKEFDVGKYVRRTYDDFLPKIYTPDDLYAESTTTDRTKASLQLFLASCFPPVRELIWNKDLLWQPVPFEFFSKNPVLSGAYVEGYKKIDKEYKKSKEHLAKLQKEKETFAYLSEKSGWNVDSFKKAKNIFKCLRTESEWGFALPEWTKKVYPQKLTELTVQTFKEGVATIDQKKFASGYFLQKVIKDTQDKLSGKLNPKERLLFVYSAHETNLANLLLTLDVFDNQIPDYGSYVALEIRRKTQKDEPTIKILYKKPTEPEPKTLKLPGCEENCNFKKFIELTKKYVPA